MAILGNLLGRRGRRGN